jgi:hypothetical protein
MGVRVEAEGGRMKMSQLYEDSYNFKPHHACLFNKHENSLMDDRIQKD